MKKIIILVVLLAFFTESHSQEVLKEAKIKFNLPNNNWKFRNKINKDGKTI